MDRLPFSGLVCSIEIGHPEELPWEGNTGTPHIKWYVTIWNQYHLQTVGPTKSNESFYIGVRAPFLGAELLGNRRDDTVDPFPVPSVR